MKEMRRDPYLLRRLVERVNLESVGISKDDWEDGSDFAGGNPIKPPYESWASANNGESKMYFLDPDMEGEFDEGSVVSL